jgi:4-amino-4-deoxy-L-arabinose transferase-like glycosyltransferase
MSPARFRPPVWFAMFVVAAGVSVARTASILAVHTPVYDHAWFHDRGTAYWSGTLGDRFVDNPAAGAGLLVLPAVVAERLGVGLDLESQYRLIGAWKSLLFAAAATGIAAWIRMLAGGRAGWATLAILLIDPNLAAHTAVMTVDTLVLPWALLAAYATTRAMRTLSWRWWTVALLAAVLAMQSKLTALPVVGLIAVAVVVATLARKRLALDWPERWQRRLVAMIVAAPAVAFLFVWATCRFDVSPVLFPADTVPAGLKESAIGRTLYADGWPAGSFLRSLFNAVHRARVKGGAFLFGESHPGGVWYYFPVVAFYKVPWGLLACAAVGVIVAAARRSWRSLGPRSLEVLVLALWAGGFTLWMAMSPHQLGIRHYLVPLFFLLPMGALAFAGAAGSDKSATTRTLPVIGLACLAWAAVAVALRHPNALSFTNQPFSARPWLAVNESNVDWNQGIREVARYLDAHPDLPQPIYLRPMLVEPQWPWWTGVRDRVILLPTDTDPPPTRTGTLIVTTLVVSGGRGDGATRYRPLAGARYVDQIGDALLVFDLATLAREKPTLWDAVR